MISKKFLFCAFALLFTTSLFAQEEEKEGGKIFKKENLFTGGSANVSFGNNTTNLGLSPYFGYSINK